MFFFFPSDGGGEKGQREKGARICCLYEPLVASCPVEPRRSPIPDVTVRAS